MYHKIQLLWLKKKNKKKTPCFSQVNFEFLQWADSENIFGKKHIFHNWILKQMF